MNIFFPSSDLQTRNLMRVTHNLLTKAEEKQSFIMTHFSGRILLAGTCLATLTEMVFRATTALFYHLLSMCIFYQSPEIYELAENESKKAFTALQFSALSCGAFVLSPLFFARCLEKPPEGEEGAFLVRERRSLRTLSSLTYLRIMAKTIAHLAILPIRLPFLLMESSLQIFLLPLRIIFLPCEMALRICCLPFHIAILSARHFIRELE